VYAIVLGEGLVNDALAILLFRYSMNVKTLKDEIEMVSFLHIIKLVFYFLFLGIISAIFGIALGIANDLIVS
jgi:NhaP-type Na+/H+ or K+/H+ antiporter